MQIHPLYQGLYTVDASHQMIPYDAQNATAAQRKMLLGITPFLLREANEFLLLDTGLPISSAPYSLSHQLRNLGIAPERIKAILFSHLHHDHMGGALLEDNQLQFPHAVHIMHKKHLEFILENGSEIEQHKAQILQAKAKLYFLDAEKSGRVHSRVKYGVTHGHCPYHVNFTFEDRAGASIFYGGDEAPQLGQMKVRMVAKYDHDGKEADRLRNLWWQQGKAEGWIFLFYHDVNSQIFYS